MSLGRVKRVLRRHGRLQIFFLCFGCSPYTHVSAEVGEGGSDNQSAETTLEIATILLLEMARGRRDADCFESEESRTRLLVVKIRIDWAKAKNLANEDLVIEYLVMIAAEVGPLGGFVSPIRNLQRMYSPTLDRWDGLKWLQPPWMALH